MDECKRRGEWMERAIGEVGQLIFIHFRGKNGN
jgi:hypothetical protein